ncbi:MAG TPA: wax ester/triacylglycerol synthase domain-containing protein [Mycobacterium sp.]|nr:wax ester/triacylglycerol synthase domain-containing protein [Mycobacterium sp.]
MTPGQRMLHSDAFAWYMEKDPVLRSTLVAIARLDRSPDWAQLKSRIDRLTRLVPPLRMCVQAPPLRVGPPRWTVDASFDLDFHLRRARIAEPAGWPEVVEFARTAAMESFDRDRPLWVFTLLDGMADGGAAAVMKLHHSLTDGIGGIQLAGLVLDPGPDSPPLDAMPAQPQGRQLSTLELTTRSLGDDLAEAANAAGRIVRALPGATVKSILDPVGAAKAALDTTVSVGRIVRPINRQASTVLGARCTGRVLSTMDVPFADLHTAATVGGGRLNDAYLAALVGGMHRYHQRSGGQLPQMRVTVPVSIRDGNDPIGGNRITLIRVKVPASIDEPAERIRRIAQIMRRWQGESALGHTQEIAFGLNLLPRPYLGGIFKRVELLASDVPGVPQPMWLAGARVVGYYAFGPTIGSGLNATLMSYAGTCNVGINVDTGAVDDPQAMLECVREGFAEVLALARPGRNGRRPKASANGRRLVPAS